VYEQVTGFRPDPRSLELTSVARPHSSSPRRQGLATVPCSA